MRGLRGLGIQGLANPVFSAGCPGGLNLAGTILSYNPILYMPMNELTGTTIVNYGSLGTAANGTYSGVTLNQIDAPGGGRAGLWDGVNDQGNPWSAALAAAHTPTEQTVLIWWRVYNAAVWTDATYRQAIQVAYDTNTNRAYAGRVSITDNGIYGVIRTNGAYKSTTTTSYANLSWHLSALTVSYSADQFKHYEDATQIGATQTGLGTWANAITDAYTKIGSQGGSVWWYGYLAHAAIYNSVLTLPQIANIYAAGGV